MFSLSNNKLGRKCFNKQLIGCPQAGLLCDFSSFSWHPLPSPLTPPHHLFKWYCNEYQLDFSLWTFLFWTSLFSLPLIPHKSASLVCGFDMSQPIPELPSSYQPFPRGQLGSSCGAGGCRRQMTEFQFLKLFATHPASWKSSQLGYPEVYAN